MQTTAIPKNHMDIPWHEYSGHGNCPITEADLTEKASIVGRVGLMLLSCGTGAWRVRSSMNTISQNLGITCSTDIGLMSIEYTCFDGTSGFSQSLCLTNTGVNTSKLNRLERFIGEFSTVGKTMTGEQLHDHLDEIDRIHGLYSPVALGFAAALACGAFTFLLGGGPVEMLFAFCGAGLGNFVRCKLTKHHLTLFLGIVASVAAACVTYTILLRIAELIAGVSLQHEAGYICSMLFIIPGFPFITSGIDLAKLDMRSGLERLTYAIIIIVVATITAWLMALLLHLHPVDFPALSMSVPMHIILRLVFSFCGVFGFSIMFNSPWKLAATAALIGAVANTLRLELVDLASFPPAAAAFVGALLAGILASLIKKPGGISKDFTYGSVDCHYGTGTVSVPGNLQSGGDVFEYLCILVCFCNFNYCGTAAWSDLCKNSDRPDIPVLYIEIRLFPYGSTNPGKILTPLYFRKDLQKQTN